MEHSFQDHFSGHAGGYASFRPSYPDELFRWLAGRCETRGVAWDCATGSGQAATGLAPFFESVIATDASAAQIEKAKPADRVSYRVGSAEASGLPDRAVDLVTVAQSLHWFDRERFFAEVKRVAKPGAPLACWMYNLMTISSEVDAVVRHLYSSVLSGFWPADRALIDSDYRTIEFPFDELEPPAFTMAADWTLAQVLGYLRTWSGVSRYAAARGEDPVLQCEPDLSAAWGRGGVRRVEWPLTVRVALVQ